MTGVLGRDKWRRSLIRVTGLESGGRTVTALLRSSRWQNHPQLPTESAGPVLLVRGADRVALLLTAQQERPQTRLLRLPRTVGQHDRWARAIDGPPPTPPRAGEASTSEAAQAQAATFLATNVAADFA